MGKRSEGPRAPLFYTAAAFVLLCGKTTTAQTVDLSALERCAGLETEDLKLACFEGIIAISKTPDTSKPEATDVPVPEPPVAESRQEAPVVDAAAASSAAMAVTSEPPVEVSPKEAPAAVTAAESTPAAGATPAATVAETPEPSTAAPATAADPLANSRLGEEHLDPPESEKKAKQDEVVYVTVSEVTKGRNDILYFHFDNGQVWRQIEARNFQYPRSGEFDARITRGMMGEYRMRIGDNSRMVRIRRVK